MLLYTRTTECKRFMLLQHFGELLCDGTAIKMDCGNCSSCDARIGDLPREADFTIEAKLLFQAITDTHEGYGSTRIIKILRGSEAREVSTGDKRLSAYGTGKSRSKKWWEAFHRKLQPEWLAPQHKQIRDLKWVAFALTTKAQQVLSGEEQLLHVDPLWEP